MEFVFSKDPAECACQKYLMDYFDKHEDNKIGTFQDYHRHFCKKHSEDDMLCGECLKETHYKYTDFAVNFVNSELLDFNEFVEVLFNYLAWMERRYIEAFEITGEDTTDKKEVLQLCLDFIEKHYNIKIDV